MDSPLGTKRAGSATNDVNRGRRAGAPRAWRRPNGPMRLAVFVLLLVLVASMFPSAPILGASDPAPATDTGAAAGADPTPEPEGPAAAPTPTEPASADPAPESTPTRTSRPAGDAGAAAPGTPTHLAGTGSKPDRTARLTVGDRIVADGFARRVEDGWGRAPGTDGYHLQGPDTAFQVDGHAGLLRIAAAGRYGTATIAASRVRDVDV